MTTYSVFYWFVLCWIGVAIVVFMILLRIPVPYGRTARRGWGPLISSRGGWIAMESIAPVLFLLLFLRWYAKWNAVSIVFLFLWQLHYVNRAFFFPFRMKSTKKKMALSVVGMALIFNMINGFINGTYLFSMSTSYGVNWFRDFRFIAGIGVFLTGFLINVISDESLRKQRAGKSREYIIPRGFLFRWISCPNYFGEVIEWLGWALITWSLAGLSFFVWTCANLIPRALTYHRWYLAHFPDYPPQRKALFPFAL